MPLFRSALYLASPHFYRMLDKKRWQAENLTGKELATVQKYFNRACFRPTPFGLFASISCSSWSNELYDHPVSDYASRLYLTLSEGAAQKINEAALQSHGKLVPYEGNPTLYRVSQNFRFIRTDVIKERRIYQLQSIGYSSVLDDLLRFCKKGKQRAEVSERIAKKAGCDAAEAEAYFNFLTEAQILLPKQRARITGIPELDGYADPAIAGQNEKITELLNRLGDVEVADVSRLQSIRSMVDGVLGNAYSNDDAPYLNVILKRNFTDHHLPSEVQQSIFNGLYALRLLCKQHDIPALKRFIQGFLQHFEGQRLPLMTALDPERGIGYQEAESEYPNPLLETVNIHPRTRSVSGADWTNVHIYLLEQWMEAERNNRDVIDLDEQKLDQIAAGEGETATFGFSVLFRICQKKVFIESAGGTNAPALIGRFTVTDEYVWRQAREMAEWVEGINPGIIFAELLHLTDPHTDNVNRRMPVWRFEIPITAAPTKQPVREIISLDDLFVEVRNGKVMLWSKNHHRYVIPRLTSAYNHSINELPLFRFLADLSFQYGINNLSFELKEYFPGLRYYPRVCYRSAILSLATWIFPAADLAFLQSLSHDMSFKRFQVFAAEHRIPGVFSIAEGDQHIVFFRDDTASIMLLSDAIRNKERIVLKEVLAATTAPNPADDIFVKQYNAFLLPDAPISMPDITPETGKRKYPRKFIPGSEWLYLKIYVSRLGAGKILLKIWPLLKRKYLHGPVQKWFFIRYEDHAPHLRLRIQLNPNDINSLLLALREVLEDHIHQQVIREYQLDVYSRELERYAAAGIEKSEDLFAASSHFVVCYLADAPKLKFKATFLSAMVSTWRMLEVFLPDFSEREEFLERSFKALLAEFEGKRIRYELDLKFRQNRAEITQILSLKQPFGRGRLGIAFNRLIKQAGQITIVLSRANHVHLDYVQSVLHMHLNRLFTDEQRKQEMIIYYLLGKWMKSERSKRR